MIRGATWEDATAWLWENDRIGWLFRNSRASGERARLYEHLLNRKGKASVRSSHVTYHSSDLPSTRNRAANGMQADIALEGQIHVTADVRN